MLNNDCESFHSECAPKEMKIGADCHRRVSLIFTHVFGWTLGVRVTHSALSLGESVASPLSRESWVRDYLVMLGHLILLRRATDPSPGPRRLVKAPVAVHPLPFGEGEDPICLGGGEDPNPSLSHRGGFRLPTAYCLLLTAYFIPPTPSAWESC
jgi:hypothetical protein